MAASGLKTAVIVAAIGALGTLGAAIISGWFGQAGSATTSTVSAGGQEPASSTSTAPSVTTGPSEAVLELVDVTPKGTPEAPMIDIMIRNPGEEVVFITRVVFIIEQLDAAALSGQVVSSATYDVEFPVWDQAISLPVLVSIDVSQSVDPNDVDRFSVAIGVPQSGRTGLYNIYQVTVSVVYNAEHAVAGPSDLIRLEVNNR